ncbi:MAG: NADH:ubiquinone oxidoreductase [Geoglossum umbratile]|nr:MAG: NADH:ubiquinone oxidoreductase [Geoglossum umbratile]
MPSPLDEPPSSPPNESSSLEHALAYYKSQYEQLELELAEFQASSRELEAELEKDVEASEKRERQLQEKVESLGFEVDEWKTKYKQTKSEANSVQNTLQKEITTLRDANRTIQLKLRDIEVANDDFERQARNTSSSLEDLESKYNVAIERAVMLESEIHAGDQEREGLRIETQRLRDELADLKIEAEINQEKLRHLEAAAERHRHPPLLATGGNAPHSPVSEASPTSTASSPVITTPPSKSASSTASKSDTPPSPPISEASATVTPAPKTPNPTAKSKLVTEDANTTPRPSHFRSARPPRHSRGPSIPVSNGRSTPSVANRAVSRPNGPPASALPSSSSLRQIRGLIGQMQRLEQRVHSARSKLPAPVHTPPRPSPTTGDSLGQGSYIPATVTMRSHKKRTGGSNASTASSVKDGLETTPLSTQHVSRLSLNGAGGERRPSGSRPSSRASTTSRSSISRASGQFSQGTNLVQRPSSRASISGSRTPLGHYSSSAAADSRRPRSSIGGNYASIHGHSASVSGIEEKDLGFSTPTSRRSTINKSDLAQGSGIPTPSGIPKRQSGGPIGFGLVMTPGARRTSSGLGLRDIEGDMGPPIRRKLSGVGETY